MSFRVKTTHKLLENNPKSEPKATMSFYESKTPTYPANSQNKNGPKGGSQQGMAIRVVNTAQADHM